MKLWRSRAHRQGGQAGEIDSHEAPNDEGSALVTDESSGPADASSGVAGERRIPSVNRVRSLQSRVSTMLATGLVSAIGVALEKSTGSRMRCIVAAVVSGTVSTAHAAFAASSPERRLRYADAD